MRKGKTTDTRSNRIQAQEQLKLPLTIKENHKDVTLGIFFYVDGVLFLHYTSRKFGLRTIEGN